MFLKKALSSRAILFLGVGALCSDPETSQASVVWYINDYDGWAAAAGDVHTIDFETLPDGSPSVASTPITLDFNYTDQGVTFSGPIAPPFIVGNPISTFGLSVDSSPELDFNWITADLTSPARAVGVWFPSFTILSIYDDGGMTIDSRVAFKSGTLGFVGAISDDPIASSISSVNSSFVTIGSYHFAPVPEPATWLLLSTGAAVLASRVMPRKRP